MSDLFLDGCRPAPLARYLKAIGILRLVSQQADPDARGRWVDDRFVLSTALDESALVGFFLHDYAPTPIVAPWNGGSGFHPKDNRRAIDAIWRSTAQRFDDFRHTLDACRAALDQLGLSQKPDSDAKLSLLKLCRNTLPDAALDWFDAALVLTGDGPKYPPLLGTGGNDGRLDFTNNYMQRLVELFDVSSAEAAPDSRPLLRQAIFAEAVDGLRKSAIGQFLPAGAGGANASTGYDGEAVVNPWDFVFMLEGAIAFASAVVRRMEQDPLAGALSYPFAVRQVGVGYGSAAVADEQQARPEMWLPLWGEPVKFSELRYVFAEGRARVGGRRARTGVDFARAASTLGVDRGIDDFVRYGFQVRNGLSYLATPLGRLEVRERPTVRLLDNIDAWMDRFRRAASSDRAPASVRRARAHLDRTVMSLCHDDGTSQVQGVLLALGACQRTLDRSLRWALDSYLSPLPCLELAWLREADDGSPEYRLACSLASLRSQARTAQGTTRYRSIRENIEHVAVKTGEGRSTPSWRPMAGREVVAGGRGAQALLCGLMRRRLLQAEQARVSTYPERSLRHARLADVVAFIEGGLDGGRLEALFRACALLDWEAIRKDRYTPARDAAGREPEFARPTASYALLKLLFSQAAPRGVEVALDPRPMVLASLGDMERATACAARRLRASGLVPAIRQVYEGVHRARRTAAALLFPLGRADLDFIAVGVLRPPANTGANP